MELLGNRKTLLDDRQLGLEVRVWVAPDPAADEADAGTRCERAVAGRGRALDDLLEDRAGLRLLSQLVERVRVEAQQLGVRGQQGVGSLG